jgi:hypothetical protein
VAKSTPAPDSRQEKHHHHHCGEQVDGIAPADVDLEAIPSTSQPCPDGIEHATLDQRLSQKKLSDWMCGHGS